MSPGVVSSEAMLLDFQVATFLLYLKIFPLYVCVQIVFLCVQISSAYKNSSERRLGSISASL